MKNTFTQITERYKKHRRRRDFAFHNLSEVAEDLMDSIEDQKVFLDLKNQPFSKAKVAQIKRVARAKVSPITWSDSEVISDTFFWFYYAIYDTTLNLRLQVKSNQIKKEKAK